MASDLFAKTGPVCAGELCRWPPVNPDLKTHSPVGELRESDGSYREFVEQYAPSVLRVAYTILGNRGAAEEIAQDAFVTAWFSTKGCDTRSSHFGRVYRIVVKECYRFLATRRPADNGALDRMRPRRDLLNKALARIPEEDRYLLLLREIEGYSVTQVSEATKLDEWTIKNSLLATRRRLARDLGYHDQV